MSLRTTLTLALLALGAACGSDSTGNTGTGPEPLPTTPRAMSLVGNGQVGTPPTAAPFTAEIAVRGTTAYTSTWATSSVMPGNQVIIWDVSGNDPQRVGTVTLETSVLRTGDVQVSDDGKLLMVATEPAGSIALYSLTNPRAPVLVSRYAAANLSKGVHTAKFGRVNGTLYAFLAVDPALGSLARIVILDLTDPAAPREVFAKDVGNPYVHDVFFRDGVLFLGLWNDGMAVWDVGSGRRGGTPQAPVEMGRIATLNGHVHNIWWFKDPSTGSARYAFVGEENAGSVGNSSSGDIHVVDVTNFAAMREVAVFSLPGAGTHNFSMDEANGVLYAAYYNAGVRGIDVRGDLSTCTAAEKVSATDSRCSLNLMKRELSNALTDRRVYVWGVQFADGFVYASDMLNGIWKLRPPSR